MFQQLPAMLTMVADAAPVDQSGGRIVERALKAPRKRQGASVSE